MPSLTPQQRADDTVWEAMKEGLASGGLAMIPSSLAGKLPRLFNIGLACMICEF